MLQVARDSGLSITWTSIFEFGRKGEQAEREQPAQLAAPNTGVSQTLVRVTEQAGPAAFSHFVILRKSEAEGEQAVLLAHVHGPAKPKPLRSQSMASRP